MLKKQNVTDRQMERQKLKNSIFPQKQFPVPISQCLPPSSKEKIFSGIGVLTIVQLCGFYMIILKTALFLISIQCSISLGISRI